MSKYTLNHTKTIGHLGSSKSQSLIAIKAPVYQVLSNLPLNFQFGVENLVGEKLAILYQSHLDVHAVHIFNKLVIF